MYSRILLQNGEFPALQDFLLTSLEQFNKEKFFNRNNHEEKLTLLTYLVNCSYKNKQHNLSLKYAEKLREAMSEFDAFLEDKYMFYYYNALVLNYGETDKQKSLKVLKEASQNEVIKSIPAYSSFIYLNTSIIYFQTKQFKLAQKNISRLILQHDFVNLDNVFQFQVYLLQIILKVELKHFASAKEKIKTLLSCYKKLLKDKIYSIDKDLVSIINDIIDSKSVQEKTSVFIKNYSDTVNSSRTTVIDYISWIKKYVK
jgi:tetratricopeptide (TPR) repeat protein